VAALSPDTAVMSGREFAGTLRERVVVEGLSGARDALGVAVAEWVVVARCFAAIVPEGNAALAVGEALSALPRYRVTIRVRDGISAGQRLRWGERVLSVRQRIDDPGLPDRIVLHCEETRG
jgi:head-tail adaptor